MKNIAAHRRQHCPDAARRVRHHGRRHRGRPRLCRLLPACATRSNAMAAPRWRSTCYPITTRRKWPPKSPGRAARARSSSHLQSRLGLKGRQERPAAQGARRRRFCRHEKLAATIKCLPLTLRAPRPLDEAISSAGGVRFETLDEASHATRPPGTFVAGEMLDWEAPPAAACSPPASPVGTPPRAARFDWLRKISFRVRCETARERVGAHRVAGAGMMPRHQVGAAVVDRDHLRRRAAGTAETGIFRGAAMRSPWPVPSFVSLRGAIRPTASASDFAPCPSPLHAPPHWRRRVPAPTARHSRATPHRQAHWRARAPPSQKAKGAGTATCGGTSSR